MCFLLSHVKNDLLIMPIWLAAKFEYLLPLPFLIKIVIFYDHITEYIVQRQPLGGLLFLLPQMFNFDSRDDVGIYHQNHGKELLHNVMVELEQLLIHANIPVSGTNSLETRDHCCCCLFLASLF